MTNSTGRYMTDKPNFGPQDAYDIAKKTASNPISRKRGVNLFGDTTDSISLLYHATRHFGIEVLGMEVKDKVKPVTRRIKARKAKEWKTFINGQKIYAVPNLMISDFDIKKTIGKVKRRAASSPMQKLDQLIGLNQVKAQIRDIGHLMKNRNDRRRARLPTIDMSQHLVFTGNPGTGKTTVARLVGKIYRELGLLKKGQFIEIDGRGLIAEYIGHTAIKSLRAKDGSDDPPEAGGRNPTRNFHRQKRSNDTHESATDPESRLFRKGRGKEARLYYMGHALMENRHGLVVDGDLTRATGTAERDTAIEMVTGRPGQHPITVGADKLYDTKNFVAELRGLNATPHVAQNDTNRRSAIDARTTRHSGYEVSQQVRKRVEEIFGWGKEIGPIRKTKFRGEKPIRFQLLLTFAGYNLIRMRNILAEVPT